MRVILTTVVVAIFTLEAGRLSAQQFDPSIQPVDLSVNARVQDPDRPASALLPGGSSAWTGQPIMSQTASAPSQKASDGKSNPFPSLTSMSMWGTFSVVDSSLSDADSVPTKNALPATKSVLSRKLNLTAPTIDLHPAKSVDEDELAAEVNQLTQSSAAFELRRLRQSTSRSVRSARLRLIDPFSTKADAASAGLWHSDQSSAYALEQQQHEAGMLLQNGFNDRTERQRRRHRHHGSTHTLGSHE